MCGCQEDNAFGLEVLTALLESASMTVHVATDGQYAVAQYIAEVLIDHFDG